MNRFIAVLWNERSSQAEADGRKLTEGVLRERPKWTRAWDKPGIVVFEGARQSAGDDALAIGDTAFFMGAVFDRGGAPATAASVDAAKLASSAAEAGFSNVWGRYVAFVRNEPDACAYVARDPSGALPCFHGKRGAAFAFFSHPDDIAVLDVDRKWIDWTYVSQRLARNRLVSTRTGLEGVASLPPGAIARVGQGRCAVRQAWDGARVATSAESVDQRDAAIILRESVTLACGAWAGRFENAGLRLSGGLDSSIVLAAIAGKTDIEALNFATPNAEGDERAYARAAAAFAGVPLIEHVRDPARVDLESAVSHASTLNPHLWLADGESDAVEAEFGRRHRLQAFFSGRGGDNVFFRSEEPHVLADWLKARGAGPAFWRRSWAYAAETGAPVFAAVSDAFKLASKTPASGRFMHPPWLTQKALALANDERALEDCEGDEALPPGKRQHLRVLIDRLNYFDYRPHADYIYPLVSQPVIETCLALPTYTLSPAGADRGLAREAFKDKIAPAVLQRHSKGRTNSYLARILMHHVSFLRSYLLDGALVGEGLVEPRALSQALNEGAFMQSMETMSQVVGLLGVEAWLRNPPCAGSNAQDSRAISA